MKRIWAMWHVMVEQFADVACYGERFRWEAMLFSHSSWTRDPAYIRFGLSFIRSIHISYTNLTSSSFLHFIPIPNPNLTQSLFVFFTKP
ncbi:hypothetical protein Hanom_Chr12g01146471 [Helianthus anomalus]